jgi:hypothetical protein
MVSLLYAETVGYLEKFILDLEDRVRHCRTGGLMRRMKVSTIARNPTSKRKISKGQGFEGE